LRVRRAGAWVELVDADVIVLVVWPSENERRKWGRADLDRMEKERGGCVHLTIMRVFSVARLAGADSALGINEHGVYMEETVCRMGQARAKWQ
jgi:heme-degrading monooxygenase HmoA